MSVFQIPTILPDNLKYVEALINNPSYFISRHFVNRCTEWFKKHYSADNMFFTNSCTSALEMVCLAEGWGKGDEVIMPSFTYVSTANAFAKFGVTPVFADIQPSDMNISPEAIERCITAKTKAIVVVHYGGISCNMKLIQDICSRHKLTLVEDAAHCFNAYYADKRLGTIGSYGAISFDHTKNIHSGQGGVLLVNDTAKTEKIAAVFENGTNRMAFFDKKVPYFEWTGLGSKYILSDINAAFLLAQLENFEMVHEKRMSIWNLYCKLLTPFESEYLELPKIPEYATHNGHVFFIKLKDADRRNELKAYLEQNDIQTAFHFIPLHNSAFGKKNGITMSTLHYTETESNRLLRLPIHYEINSEEVENVVELIKKFLSI